MMGNKRDITYYVFIVAMLLLEHRVSVCLHVYECVSVCVYLMALHTNEIRV